MTAPAPSQPACTIIIPVHDRANTLRRTVESVLAQTMADYEVVIVDDGSHDDETSRAIDEICARDARFRSVIRERNGGPSAARNAGIAVARGRAVVFLDSDDEVEPTWLAQLTNRLDDQTGMVCCAARFLDESGSTTDVRKPRVLGPLHGRRRAIFLAGTFLVRREVLDAAGLYVEHLWFGENYELGTRLVAACDRAGLEIATTDEPLLRTHRVATRRHEAGRLHLSEHLLARHRELLQTERSERASLEARAAVNASRLGLDRLAFAHAARAVGAAPADPRQWVRLATAAVPPVAARRWSPELDRVDASRAPFPIIFGAAASEVEAVRVLFDAHPELTVPDGGGFLPRYIRHRRRYEGLDGVDTRRLADDLLADPGFRRWGLGDDVVLGALSGAAVPDVEGALRLVYRLVARDRGKQRYGDASRRFARHVRDLARSFPEARFVHVLGMAVTTRARVREMAAARSSRAVLGPRYRQVRYGDLIARPEEMLRDVCDFLELSFDPVILPS